MCRVPALSLSCTDACTAPRAGTVGVLLRPKAVLNEPVASPKRGLCRWLKNVFLPRPVLTVHVPFDQTGRGATFNLFRESEQWLWDWLVDGNIAVSSPNVRAKVEAECRWAVTAMESRLELPLTFPGFAEIPERMKRLSGWPWQPTARNPKLTLDEI